MQVPIGMYPSSLFLGSVSRGNIHNCEILITALEISSFLCSGNGHIPPNHVPIHMGIHGLSC